MTKVRKKSGAIQIGTTMELRLCYVGGSAARLTERQQKALENLADVLKVALPHVLAGLDESSEERLDWRSY